MIDCSEVAIGMDVPKDRPVLAVAESGRDVRPDDCTAAASKSAMSSGAAAGPVNAVGPVRATSGRAC